MRGRDQNVGLHFGRIDQVDQIMLIFVFFGKCVCTSGVEIGPPQSRIDFLAKITSSERVKRSLLGIDKRVANQQLVRLEILIFVSDLGPLGRFRTKASLRQPSFEITQLLDERNSNLKILASRVQKLKRFQ